MICIAYLHNNGIYLHCSESELADITGEHDLVTAAVIHQPADAHPGQVQVYLFI